MPRQCQLLCLGAREELEELPGVRLTEVFVTKRWLWEKKKNNNNFYISHLSQGARKRSCNPAGLPWRGSLTCCRERGGTQKQASGVVMGGHRFPWLVFFRPGICGKHPAAYLGWKSFASPGIRPPCHSFPSLCYSLHGCYVLAPFITAI